MIDPYEALAQAIVVQAAKDYRKAAHKLKYHPKSSSAAKELAECRKFFLSDWFTDLSGLNGELILKRLEQEDC